MYSIKKIVKRDGRTVDFDVNKIADAIFKAAQVLGGRDREMSMYLARQVELYLLEVCHNSVPTVEQIQDAVEKILIENGHARTAKEFILYRAERTRVRDMNTKLMKIYEDLTFKEAKDNDVKRENANIDGNTAMGTMLKYGSEGAKEFYKMYVIDPKHVKAHEQGDIHIHDMDYDAQNTLTNCCLINLDDMLQNGTVVNGITIDRPHKLLTAMTIATQIIAAVASSQYGGTTITLTHLSPFVRDSYNRYFEKYQEWGVDKEKSIEYAEKDVKKEITDAIQTLNYQLNSLTTTNG